MKTKLKKSLDGKPKNLYLLLNLSFQFEGNGLNNGNLFASPTLELSIHGFSLFVRKLAQVIAKPLVEIGQAFYSVFKTELLSIFKKFVTDFENFDELAGSQSIEHLDPPRRKNGALDVFEPMASGIEEIKLKFKILNLLLKRLN